MSSIVALQQVVAGGDGGAVEGSLELGTDGGDVAGDGGAGGARGRRQLLVIWPGQQARGTARSRGVSPAAPRGTASAGDATSRARVMASATVSFLGTACRRTGCGLADEILRSRWIDRSASSYRHPGGLWG